MRFIPFYRFIEIFNFYIIIILAGN